MRARPFWRSNTSPLLLTWQEGVYDVTDFVANHPGGTEKILMASGGAVDAFWQLYPQHYASAAALAVLTRYRVGTLAPQARAARVFARAAARAR